MKPVTIELQQELDEAESRSILDFCLSRGVDSFTVTFLNVNEFADGFFEKLSPFSLGRRRLEQVFRFPSQPWNQDVEHWVLNNDSITLILEASDGSLTNYRICEIPEDWIFYRKGELFLGIVSHEDYCFARYCCPMI